MIKEVLIETLQKTANIAILVVPLLLIVEYLNHKYGDRLIRFFEKRERVMPFWAALISLLPGCNAAVAIGVLYLRGVLSIGALIAAMIATSDEAIYVFIPRGFNFLPLFAAKFILAITAGATVDFVLRHRAIGSKKNPKLNYCCTAHHHEHTKRGMLMHSLWHGTKIVFFVFSVLFAFNYLKDSVGFEKISRSIFFSKDFSPFFAGLLGLVPGCGTSVVLATLYTEKILSFGAAVAGLSVASGDVLLVLLSNKIGRGEFVKIITPVFLFSVLFGYLLTLFV